MLHHNITGMVYAARVRHVPTGVRFNLTVGLADEGPRPDFDVLVHAPPDVPRARLDGWDVLAVGSDLFAARVYYSERNARYDWLPTILIQAPREFAVRFDNVLPHPRLGRVGRWTPDREAV